MQRLPSSLQTEGLQEGALPRALARISSMYMHVPPRRHTTQGILALPSCMSEELRVLNEQSA